MSNHKWRTQQKINAEKQERLAKREEKLSDTVDYNALTDRNKLIRAFHVSQRDVKWKAAVQKFIASPLYELEEIAQSYAEGSYKTELNKTRVSIYERGKERQIVPIRFKQRIVEHVICDNVLLPIFESKLIYTNGASMKGKGTEFSRMLMNEYTAEAISHGYQYAVQFDVKSYFDSIPHWVINEIIRENVKDKKVADLIMEIALSFQRANIERQFSGMKREVRECNPEYIEKIRALENYEMRGVCLGSQISQIVALFVLNDLDHYIKDNLGMKYYVRYMDDGVILCKDKAEAEYVLKAITRRIKRVDLSFNMKKTKITKMSKGFTFLKVQYFAKGTKIIRKLHRSGVIRMRRKLKKFIRLVAIGKMDVIDVFNSLQSWWSHSFIAKAYHERRKMLDLYKKNYDFKVIWLESRIDRMPTKNDSNKVVPMYSAVKAA